jgi:predicted MFS family arabinose efflux permease
VQGAAPRMRDVVAVASLITVGFMGSVIVTPLYALYQQRFGFSEITLTLVYAVYVVGNVLALLVFGQVSDQLGRKPVALPALGLAAVSALLFLFAQGTAWLYVARLLIGLATGVLSGTATAWLAEQYGVQARSAATFAATGANLLGIALGPLVGGLLAQYAPWPLVLPFVVYLAAVSAAALAAGRVDEPPGADRLRSVRELRVQPRLGVPRDRLGAFAPPAIAGFVTFALGGLYFALIPTIVIEDLHEADVAVGALLVFELGAVALAVNLLCRRLPAAAAMTSGLLALLPAVALLVVAQAAGSMPVLVVASALAGVVLALGYRGSLQVVNVIAPDQRRAEVVSSYLIAVFLGNAVPVIGVGVLSTLTDAFIATVTFAGVVATLAVVALAGARLRVLTPRSGPKK